VGEVSDVYKALLVKSDRVVAVKIMRGITSDVEVRRRFEEQLLLLVGQWQTMKHPNIMECFGICRNFGPVPGMVLPLCSKGSIMRFVKNNSSVNRLFLLVQVAAGLNYLHSREFVHGDIRGSNILITPEGVPVLMDCGLSSIVARGAEFTTAGICGPCRWMSPEILDPPDDLSDVEELRSLFTMSSDVYSYGMTMLEVLTGEVPFAHRRYDTVVILDVIRGTRPPRPAIPAMSDDVWDILQRCWEVFPDNRPSAKLVESWINTVYYLDETRNSSQSEASSSTSGVA